MAGFFYDWSVTAADNDDADSTINFAENQTPGSVNNSARALMASVASWRKDLTGTLSTAGSSNAYTIASPNIAYAAYATGITIGFKANHTNTGAATLSVNAVGAKAIRTSNDAALSGGEIQSGGQYTARYDAAANSSAGAWILLNQHLGALGGSTFSGAITPLTNDGAALGTSSLMWSDLFLASGSVINWNNGDVTLTHATNTLVFAGAASGYSFDNVVAVTTAIFPVTSDGASLGTTSAMFSDLFVASGAVLNFNNGNYTVTHSAGLLTASGGLTVSGTATMNTFASSGATITGGSISGITDLAVADGGTGASTASDARTNLGLGSIATQSASSVTITGGTINNTAIGGSTAAAGAFTTLTASSTATLNTFASSGATITGGTINNAAIGGSTPAAGAFTTLSATGTVSIASGQKISFASDDVTVTHSSNTLTWAGAASGYVFNDGSLGVGASPSAAAKVHIRTGTDKNLYIRTSFITGSSGIAFQSLNNAESANVPFEIAAGTSAVYIQGNPVTFEAATISFGGNALPASNDGAALGSTSLMWSDLFLASGAVVNFNNGNVTLTHSTSTLTLAGSGGLAARNTAKAFGVSSGGALVAGFNVSSITDNGTNHTIGFTTSMSGANYSPVISFSGNGTADFIGFWSTPGTGSFLIHGRNIGVGNADPGVYSFAVFENA